MGGDALATGRPFSVKPTGLPSCRTGALPDAVVQRAADQLSRRLEPVPGAAADVVDGREWGQMVGIDLGP
jgi:hypothetical protein